MMHLQDKVQGFARLAVLTTALATTLAWADTPANEAPTASADPAPGDAEQHLDKVVVTGSLIRNSSRTGFNQVQMVTAQEIESSGATTVADYLRGTSANSGSSYDESTVLNQSPGATGIALRGLSVKYSLVLVDGQRVAPYGFASGGTDTLVDLNTLPLNMIDHLEIVKTGAVSQYGSDAIAGVVNIITKRAFRGLVLDGTLGGAQQGGAGTRSLGVLGGHGDLDRDRYNVTAALSYLHRDGVSLAQRGITANENYLGQYGGYFAQPSSFWSTPNGPQALASCGSGAQLTPAADNLQTQSPGTVCSQNGAGAQSLAAQVERTGLKVHVDAQLGGDVQAYADLWGSHNRTALASGEAGFGAGALVPSLYDAPDAGYAPFAPAVGGNGLSYYFPDAQVVATTANFYRVAAGLKGALEDTRLGDWDWAASIGHSESRVANAYSHQIDAAVVQGYLAGVTMTSFSPTQFDALPGLFGTSNTRARSTLDTVDATIATPNLYTLPAGDVGLGLGAQFQHQGEFIGAGSTQFVNPYTQAVRGERNVGAAYYQLDLPILRSLKFSQSGRYDDYLDYGGVFSPRFALRYQPATALTLYASHDRGFRAPTLIELDEQGSVTYQVVGQQNVNEYFVGNPKLKPEHTRNDNVGFQWSPSRSADLGFDWYRIHVSDVVSQLNIAAAVAANPGQPVYTLPYANISYLDTEGFESTFRQALPTRVGTFTLSGDWAYVWHYKIPDSIVADFAGNNGANDTVFGGALPHWKGNTGLNWANGAWGATLSWQFTGAYAQVINRGANARSYSQYNLAASYSGFRHWTLFASVNNLFNRAPPYDPVWTFTYRGYYDPSLYSDVGRYGQVGATYRF